MFVGLISLKYIHSSTIVLYLSFVAFGHSHPGGLYKACIYYAPYYVSKRYYHYPHRVIVHPSAACPDWVSVKK